MAKNHYLRTSSLDLDGNLNFRRLSERKLYNDLLVGHATRSAVGQEYQPTNPNARPPSWTQHHANMSHAFVITNVSSSRHEQQNLNAYLSGVLPLESSPVPASGSVYYTKRRQLKNLTVKLSASSNSSDYSLSPGYAFSFTANKGVQCSASFPGTNDPSLPSVTPFTVKINVPVRGKIRDLKVWVEVIHESGSTDFDYRLLNQLGLAIRSPNVKNFHAIPILNNKKIKEYYKGFTQINYFTGSLGTLNNFALNSVVPFFDSTFILWLGAAVTNYTFNYEHGGSVDSGFTPTWDSNRSIRTIFDDGSPVMNPRHLDKIRTSSIDTGQLIGSTIFSLDTMTGEAYDQIIGNDLPWISDARLNGPYTDSGSPPRGWLTGPGGTNSENEFNTTGSNLGPATMKPLYPLLDAVTERIVEFTPYLQYVSDAYELVGRRPGLRGTEMFGEWELLIVTGHPLKSTSDWPDTKFRQVRLEFVYDENESLSYQNHGRKFFYKNFNNVFKNDQRYCIMSGVVSDVNFLFPSYINRGLHVIEYANEMYTNFESYGRTIGITDNTSSLLSKNFAVFSRITGGLESIYSQYDKAHARYAYLNNEFGTPYIPLSSGSGEPTSLEFFNKPSTLEKTDINNILNPKTSVGSAQNIKSVLTKNKVIKTTRQVIEESLTGSI